MPKRNWFSEHSFGVTVTVLAFATLIACCIAAFTLGRQYQYRTQTAEQNTATYGGQGNEQSEDRCRSIGGLSDAVDCLIQKIAATRETQRREQDLAAQQSMADWALWIVWASIIQAAIGLGGVVLLIRNLSVTWEAVAAAHRSNDITEQTAQRQLRAYLNIVTVELTSDFLVRIQIKNFGQTPAYKVFLDFYAATDPTDFTLPPSGRPKMTSSIGPSGSINMKIHLPANSRQKWIEEGFTLFAWGHGIYRDAFGRWHRIRFRHKLHPIPNRGVKTFAICAKGNTST